VIALVDSAAFLVLVPIQTLRIQRKLIYQTTRLWQILGFVYCESRKI